MGKNIDHINKIFEDIEVHINYLLTEQVDWDPDYEVDPDAGDDEAEALKDKELGKMTKTEKAKDLGVKILDKNQKVTWDDVLEPEDQERIIAMVDKSEDLTGYVITGGKYVGVVIGSTLKGPLKAWAVLRGKKSMLKKLPFTKPDPDICNCVELAKKYTSGAAECPNIPACKTNFETNFNTDIEGLYKTEKETAEEYYADCYGTSGYGEIMFSSSKRDDEKFKKGCRTFGNMLDDQSQITAELANLLSKFFRTKTAKTTKKSGGRSISDKIIPFAQITIDFNSPVGPAADSATYPDCVSNAFNIPAAPTKFNVISSSSFSEGKTVELETGGKYCLMTFDNATRGQANEGNVTWINGSTKKAECAVYAWKGTIIEFIK